MVPNTPEKAKPPHWSESLAFGESCISDHWKVAAEVLVMFGMFALVASHSRQTTLHRCGLAVRRTAPSPLSGLDDNDWQDSKQKVQRPPKGEPTKRWLAPSRISSWLSPSLLLSGDANSEQPANKPIEEGFCPSRKRAREQGQRSKVTMPCGLDFCWLLTCCASRGKKIRSENLLKNQAMVVFVCKCGINWILIQIKSSALGGCGTCHLIDCLQHSMRPIDQTSIWETHQLDASKYIQVPRVAHTFYNVEHLCNATLAYILQLQCHMVRGSLLRMLQTNMDKCGLRFSSRCFAFVL